MSARVALVLLAVGAMAVAAAAQTSWHQHYESGLALIQEGDAEAARAAFAEALKLEPEPQLRAHTDGPRYIDYLPYLYLAISSLNAGDADAARDYLWKSERAGVAAQSEVGSKLLESYRLLLGEEEPPRTYREFEPQPVVLSDQEFQKTQREVAMRCGIDDQDYETAPWYFHYELGLALSKKGDPQRALYALLDATEGKTDSQRSARMYGMWFIDYLPYFEIAKVHAELGNWDCAADALSMSERKQEIARESGEYADFWTLREEVMANAGQ